MRRGSLAGVWGAPAPTKLRLNHKPVTAPLFQPPPFLPLFSSHLVSPVPFNTGESKNTQLSIGRSVSQHQLKDRAKCGVGGMFERDPAEVYPTIRGKKVTSVSRTTGRPPSPRSKFPTDSEQGAASNGQFPRGARVTKALELTLHDYNQAALPCSANLTIKSKT